MAENRRGLGRGLSALLGDTDVAPQGGGGYGEAAGQLPIESLQANPNQPRRTFDGAEMMELVRSVREKGVLQPILARPLSGQPGRYEIVAGERRWRAAQAAGLRTVPAVLRELDDREVLEIAIIENVQRVDLNALEEAQGYQQLIANFGHTQEEVAQIVSKSRSHVANALRLLALPEAVRELLHAGRLSAGHARAVAGAEDPAALAQRIVEGGLSVRDAESLARKGAAAARRGKPAPRPAKDTDTRALEEDLEGVLGLKVDVLHRGGAGELRIAYANLEQLDDLCRRLTRG